jgi:uncharacterized phage protein gp47/JayE
MAFEPRVFDTILLDMMAHVRANTTLTDFSVGSNIRTILEACALEDDEQYYQMVQLLEDFSISNASGESLDERAADYNISRLRPVAASCKVRFYNDGLTTDSLSYDTLVAATLIVLDDSSDFPVSGYPYTVRIDEGTSSTEDVSVSNNDTNTGILTVTALSFAHSAGARVSEVPVGGSDYEVATGQQVQVPAQADKGPIVFETIDKATLINGNYESTEVVAKATVDGSSSNVGSGRVTQFISSPPFSGAAVSNTTAATGGRDRETDTDFRKRVKARISALSRGTPYAIETSVKGTTDPDTGQRIVAANLIEDFTTEEHLLYVDDGTGFVPDTTIMASSFIGSAGIVAIGSSTIQLADGTNFPAAGIIMISPEDATQVEIIEYSSKTGNTLSLDTLTVRQHDGTPSPDQVLLVNYVGEAEEGQNYFQLSDYPVRRNTIELYDDSTGTGSYTLRTEGTDYFLNRTNGNVQYYGAGLPSGTKVYANYTFYTGLFALVQKVVNGDPSDRVNYPGIAAGGNIIYVDTPVVRQVSVVAAITVETGIDETTVRDDVQQIIETYIDGLLIGENVIIAKIIDHAMSITGVTNITVQIPTSDVIILENELPSSTDSSGTSLVAVL